jgi:carbonic anhydrase/acetyltransferase-like protein (isoleucine patch superfamily)
MTPTAIIRIKKALIPVYHLAIPGTALAVAGAPVLAAPSIATQLVGLVLAPALFAVTYVTIAGLLSRPHQRSIVPGRFPRSLDHPIYIDRRLYGLCLTAVYYFTPLYAAVLYVPAFRRYFFRLFGYKGDLDFTIHPDTWIRDLPLVRFGKGAYVANQSTIGTNIIAADNHIWVDRVEVGAGTTIGSHSLIAPGAQIGANVEIGIRTILGLKVRIRDGVSVGPDSAIGHGAVLGEGASIGRRSEIDLRARVAPGASVPPFSRILAHGRSTLSPAHATEILLKAS